MQKSLFLYKQDNRKAQKNNKFLYPLSKQEFVINRHDSYIFKRLQKEGDRLFFPTFEY